MFRLIFLLLLAANLLFLAWTAWLVPEEDEAWVRLEQPEETRLVLADPVPDVSLEPDVSRPDDVVSLDGCVRLGPFAEVAEATAAGLELGLATPEVRAQTRDEVVAWRVFLPREQVADPSESAQMLADAGAGDFFIMTTGELAGGISLGVFSGAERAEARAEEVAALGFEPEIRERHEPRTQHWLLLPLGQALPETLRRERELQPAVCPDAPASLVTREGDR